MKYYLQGVHQRRLQLGGLQVALPQLSPEALDVLLVHGILRITGTRPLHGRHKLTHAASPPRHAGQGRHAHLGPAHHMGACQLCQACNAQLLDGSCVLGNGLLQVAQRVRLNLQRWV